MTLVPPSAARNSTVLTAMSRVRSRLAHAASEARTTTLLRRFRPDPRTADDPSDADPATPADTSDTSNDTDSADSEGTADSTATDSIPTTATGLLARSSAYRLAQRGRGFVVSSWLYGWLTAEPEPDVIVIDLRETRIVGGVLGVLDRALGRASRDLLPALPSATVTRLGSWLRGRIRARPIRVASIGLAVVANLGLLVVLAGASDPLTPTTLFLLAALLVAARGFRSTTSLAALTQTTWYQRTASALAAAFEPPEPPAPADSSPDTTTDSELTDPATDTDATTTDTDATTEEPTDEESP